ncbi:hypothetical protein BYZ73_19505 [Rhodovulum viride]|uniref:CRISPR-associated endoribonuclease Cas13a n=1 Tax=Rhodovulum viride TaxID=1231134 RepID=A0ABX9DE47_9RHOB|nr:type VI-A CRISPR-associated RNA-guided ribonuclease Cas13a [Rhodovulum viride]RAP39618.1 hypothetical protein BYZ73_19505 [Rhodovulum viride]
MPIVKKFGRSQTSLSDRKIVLKMETAARNIPDFLLSDPEAVIGQWASAMDKIAKKPKGKDKPSSYQRKFRERLGKAIWADLTGPEGPLRDVPAAELEDLRKRWDRRVHPYPDGTKDGPKPATPKGRLYTRFAGEVGYGKADAVAIARDIRIHLLETEFKTGGGTRDAGRAVRRASSIEKNVLKKARVPQRPKPPQEAAWSKEDEDRYFIPHDVARKIVLAAKAQEKEDHRVAWRTAAAVLFEHFGRIFQQDGRALSFAEAEKQMPGLLALHRAVEGYYRQALKRHRKDRREHEARPGREKGTGRRKVSAILPKDKTALLALIGHQHQNREIAALIRLGRILHYEAGRRGNSDMVANINRNWPADVSESHYWTSAGQIEIKRNEAFVRIWRSALSHANRTLGDWLSPDEVANDITMSWESKHEKSGKRKTGKLEENREEAEAHAPVIFGGSAERLGTGDDFQKTLEAICEVFSQLRHSSFHFRGLDGFKDALTKTVKTCDPGAVARLQDLHAEDQANREARLKEDLRGAHAELFLDEGRLAEIWALLHPKSTEKTLPPLPRYSRVVTRAENTCNGLKLPKSVNRESMKVPAIHCRYILTRLLYQSGFRTWIAEAPAAQLNRWIETATERAQKATVGITKNEADRARMVGQIKVPEGQGIRRFLDDLAGLTATEFRVQAGYESDREAARDQAAFLENLNCDVMALAFDKYLSDHKLGWLAGIDAESRPSETPLSNVDELPSSGSLGTPERWEAALYAVCHLIPVSEVGRLLHQLRRWSNGQKATPDGGRLERLFELYLDMHDAKFDGSTPLRDHDDLAVIFETTGIRDRVLPSSLQHGEHERLPLRGLREMLRFGNLRVLAPIFATAKVDQAMIGELEGLEARIGDAPSQVDRAQALRTEMHAALCKKRKLAHDDKKSVKDYLTSLQTVIRHRRLANHVRLTNHVRTNEILMSVMGRLADFSGIWERDLYFVTNALLYQAGLTPCDVFSKEPPKENRRSPLQEFENGQIVFALRKMQAQCDTHAGLVDQIKGETARLFHIAEGAPGNDPRIQNRNWFAHFNALKPKTGDRLDLTADMNRARDLMAYDRKLKNAVVSAIVTLLERENIVIAWTMKDHQLTDAVLAAKSIEHLKQNKIRENLRDERSLGYVAALFGGRVAEEAPDIMHDRTVFHLVGALTEEMEPAE